MIFQVDTESLLLLFFSFCTWQLCMIIGAISHVTACAAIHGGSSICHCHFPSACHCSGNCMCKAELPVTHFNMGAKDVRPLITKKTAVWCVLLCVPARAINNCDKFFVACESPWLYLLFLHLPSHGGLLPSTLVIDGTMLQMTSR